MDTLHVVSDATVVAREINTKTLRFSVLEAGVGPLALCLHGFPDSAHTWRYLLPALAAAGFHGVAPFMRGHAPTEIPADGCYSIGALVSDTVAIHDILDADENAVLIGHDWGADVAYAAGAFAPTRWRRLVTLAVPPAALDSVIFADYEQLKRLFYMFGALMPGWDQIVAADDMAFLDRLWADWSPGYDATDDLRHVKRCLLDPANLTAALDYYRGSLDPVAARSPTYSKEQEVVGRTAPQPTLYLHGENDGCIASRLVLAAPAHLSPDSRMSVVPGAGHFLHLERPADVNAQILDWISR